MERLWTDFPSEALDIHMCYVAPSLARPFPSAMQESMSLAGCLLVPYNGIHFVSI